MLRNYQKLLWHIVLVSLFVSCNAVEDESYLADCASLKTGIIEKDTVILETEINNLTSDLEPKPTNSDPLGHEQNLETLVASLNNQCERLSVEIKCYVCIKTLPAQSEILLQTDSSGILVTRVIDILTPYNESMTFFGVHE
ncbi:MAG: hypothetical protein HQ507_08840 [Candidatus Marinimicrobia bacterium]|nr:hypothetical protein [Candidatus Neomarinimicrobiota bacterium]